jgi:hypothetical protein
LTVIDCKEILAEAPTYNFPFSVSLDLLMQGIKTPLRCQTPPLVSPA